LFKQIKDAASEREADPTSASGASVPAEAGSPGGPDVGLDAAAGDEGDQDSEVTLEERRRAISRRGFLGGTAAVAGVAAAGYFGRNQGLVQVPSGWLPHNTGQTAHLSPATSPTETPPFDPSYDFILQVERESDLVLLDFIFYGFQVNTGMYFGHTQTVIAPTRANNVLLIRFPPQSIAEGVYWNPAPQSPPNPPNPTGLQFDPPPILSAVSGPSQLSFTFPTNSYIPLPTMTAADLLNWSGWALNVPIPAQVPQISTYVPWNGQYAYTNPYAPGPYDTYIEFPYCLFLAPSVFTPNAPVGEGFATEWSNRLEPLTSSARVTDLWTSALSQPPYYSTETSFQWGLCAIWAADFNFPAAGFSTNGGGVDVTPEQIIFYGKPPS
jgi:hypothetical protein